MSYYFKMQLFVKDKSVTNDSNMYIFFLCSVEGKGEEFINVPLGRDYPSDETLKKLKKVYQLLTRPWMKMDMIVESVEATGKQPVFFIVDTELNI